MSDLHAVLTARIDELERAAQMSAGAHPGEWVDITDEDGDWPGVRLGEDGEVDLYHAEHAWHIATWDPSTVLRGLAEDRDILRRHAPMPIKLDDPNLSKLLDFLHATTEPLCLHGRDSGGIVLEAVLWPCPEVLSVARRHRIEATDG
jgi:hypothetical protein